MAKSKWKTMTEDQKQQHRDGERARRAIRRAAMTEEQQIVLNASRTAARLRRIERIPEHHAEVARKYKRDGKGYFFTWANAIKTRATKNGIPYDLDADFLMSMMPTHCPILGVEFQRYVGHGSGPFSPTVDRIIPALGYVRSNVMIISKRANQIKSDATPEEVMQVALFLKR
jgi:hypothetical protein